MVDGKTRRLGVGVARAVVVSLFVSLLASISRAEEPAMFAPLEQWKAAVVAADGAAVKAFYSTNPPAVVYANGKKGDSALDETFWLRLRPNALRITMIGSQVRHGTQQVIFSALVTLSDGKGMTVTDQQSWQKQGEEWRLMSVVRTDAPILKQPSSLSKDIYPAAADAHVELKEAKTRAAEQHKRVLLVFGANWCFDCHVLDLAFQEPELAAVLASSYEVVHVDLGPDEKKNADLVAEYEIPLDKGVPAVAVAESDGRLVVSQKNGEFENARGMTAEAMLAFLNQWKPAAR
jgi:hypothetical protein